MILFLIIIEAIFNIFSYMTNLWIYIFINIMKNDTYLILTCFENNWPPSIPFFTFIKQSDLSCHRTIQTQLTFIFRCVTTILFGFINFQILSSGIINASFESLP